MPAKTERILGHLPATFGAYPRPTALYALADAFGGELLRVENALAEVMQAHWVDHADRGADAVEDLRSLAALYGLAPRPAPMPEETVEEFRERLRRHVRTFLDGAATLRGVLRVTADALALRIDDERLDAWWSRPGPDPALVRPRGDDAAAALFGVPHATVRGHPARAARVEGPVLPAAGADLHEGAILRLSVDGGAPVDADCAAGADDRARVPLSAVAAAVNGALGARVASDVDGRLVLASPTRGADSSLTVHEVRGDAAPVLLGLPARVRWGRAGVDAEIRGTVELPDPVDLGAGRYLRIAVDRARLAEVDCAGADPAATPLAHVLARIEEALGPIASLEAGRLVLRSPSPGAAGSLTVQEPGAEDAAPLLLGRAPREARGSDPLPAELSGAVPLDPEVDLSGVFAVRVRQDERRPVTVDAAGEDPARTRPEEAAARLAAALAPGTARYDGRLRLVAGSAGEESRLEILPVVEAEDAAPLLFGLRPRTFRGAPAAPASLRGRDLSPWVDLRVRNRLLLAVDGGREVEIDLRTHAACPRHATPAEVAAAVNAALARAGGDWIAAVESGGRLALTSLTRGTAGLLELRPLETTTRLPYLVRAHVVSEAASVLLGVPTASARGADALPARLGGRKDLSRGVDLRTARWLRVRVDGFPPVEVDCAAPAYVPRPRHALPEEIAAAIAHTLAAADPALAGVARAEGGTLVLTSIRRGAAARIVLEPPRPEDARPLLLGVEPGLWRGDEGRRVAFSGTADLSAGVDLTGGDRLHLRVEGREREVSCAGRDPSRTTLAEVVAAVNGAFGELVARGDGAHLVLSCRAPDGVLEILPPSAADGTRALLGIEAPRTYRGRPARPPRLEGAAPLPAALPPGAPRRLRIALDGGAPVEVELPAGADPAAVAAEIDAALGAPVATLEEGRLVLTGTRTGAAARIELLPVESGDARALLFGEEEVEAAGRPAAPAEVVGIPDLRQTADLSLSRTLRVAVDGGRPVDVTIAGLYPERTEPAEVLAALREALPGVASLTAEGALRLASPTLGAASRLEVLPVRSLDLVEFPAEPRVTVLEPLRHGRAAGVVNDGAAETVAELELRAPCGAASPALVNAAAWTRVRLLAALDPGEGVRFAPDPEVGVRAWILPAAWKGDEAPREVPPERLAAGSAGDTLRLPTAGERALTHGRRDLPASLRIEDPYQPRSVALRARTRGLPAAEDDPGPPERAEEPRVLVRVGEAEIGAAPAVGGAAGESHRLAGRLLADGGHWVLADGEGAGFVRVLPGTAVPLDRHAGHAVAAEGELHEGEGGFPHLVARRVDRLYDVELREEGGEGARERYAGVSIGTGDVPDSLARRIACRHLAAGGTPLVAAGEEERAAALALPRGRTEWTYVECRGPRFDRDPFAWPPPRRPRPRLPGGAGCEEVGVFDVSHLSAGGEEAGGAVFAAEGDESAPQVEVRVRWTRHAPGAFDLLLPARLPDFLGAALDEGRLGGAGAAERYAGVVTEPADDPEHLVAALAGGGSAPASRLVIARAVPRVPIGFVGVPVPFRRPRVRRLSLGRADRPARLYLTDPDVPLVVELTAKDAAASSAAGAPVEAPGAWGNAIEVQVAAAGPGRFDLEVRFAGARTESARRAALGGEHAPSTAAEINAPGPVGVLQAKAAGVAARVLRERAEAPAHPDPLQQERPS